MREAAAAAGIMVGHRFQGESLTIFCKKSFCDTATDASFAA